MAKNYVLRVVEGRKTIRKYKNKIVEDSTIDSIIKAGVWGPSVLGFQPWKMYVVKNKDVLLQLGEIMDSKSVKVGIGANNLLSSAARNITTCCFAVIVCNDHSLLTQTRKIQNQKKYDKVSRMAEIAAISASIQNMLLVAAENNIGSCWHIAPLICENEIKRFMKFDEELFAIISFGYPNENGKRSIRKNIADMVVEIL